MTDRKRSEDSLQGGSAIALRSKFAGKRVLITGATGFLGSRLRTILGGGDCEVHATSRRVGPEDGHERWWQVDLSDSVAARRTLEAIRPDVLFQLTTHGSAARGLENVLPTLSNDIVATVNVLTAAVEVNGPRVILTGALEESLPTDSEPVPTSPYGAAKQAVTFYGRMFWQLYRLPVVIVRPFMTYGPGQPVQKVIPYVIESLLERRSPRLVSGDRGVDWVYVDDLMEGFLSAAVAEGVEGSTFDLGSGELVPVRVIVDELRRLIDPAIVATFEESPSSECEEIRAAQLGAARERLHWAPSTPLAVGLRQTVDWYRQRRTRESVHACLP
jgi:nucleoside-diphosphate-sugar epimerase